MTLLIVRHGQAGNNLPTFRPGSIKDEEIPLTALGIEQAITLSFWLRQSFNLTNCRQYSSFFLRAQMTESLAGISSQHHIHDEALNEHDFGLFMSSNPPENLRTEFDTQFPLSISCLAPGGSSIIDDYHQAHSFLTRVVRRSMRHDIVLFTHGFKAAVLRMVLEGIPPTDAGWTKIYQQKQRLNNCGVIIYPSPSIPKPGDTNGKCLALVNAPYPQMLDLQFEPYTC